MDIQKAIKVIQAIAAAYNGTLAQHQEIQTAINTIITEINEKVVPVKLEEKVKKKAK